MTTNTVIRTYQVALMPDPDTTYDPVPVSLRFTAEDAARMPATASRVTSAAFRKAIALEHETHHTPPNRTFLCAGVEFVGEQLVEADLAPLVVPFLT